MDNPTNFSGDNINNFIRNKRLKDNFAKLSFDEFKLILNKPQKLEHISDKKLQIKITYIIKFIATIA